MEEEPEEPEDAAEDTTEDTEQDEEEEVDAGADEEEQEPTEVHRAGRALLGASHGVSTVSPGEATKSRSVK